MICLSNFQDGDILTFLPCACGHQYHRVCLISWLERKVTCPLCTASVGGLLLGTQQDALNRLPLTDGVIQARSPQRDTDTQSNPLNSHINLTSAGDIDVEDGRGQRFTGTASAGALPVATPVLAPVPTPSPAPAPAPAPAFVSVQSVTGRGRASRYDGIPHSSI